MHGHQRLSGGVPNRDGELLSVYASAKRKETRRNADWSTVGPVVTRASEKNHVGIKETVVEGGRLSGYPWACYRSPAINRVIFCPSRADGKAKHFEAHPLLALWESTVHHA